MATIEVLASETEAEQKLAHYGDTNMRTYEALADKGRKKELEYKAASGFNERWIKQQKHIPAVRRINPSLIALPQDEHDKVWNGVGTGFELHLLVELYAHEGGLSYRVGETWPPTYELLGEEQENISALVQAVKRTITEKARQYLGAALTPVFYTINEKRVLNKEEMPQPEQIRGMLTEMLEEASGSMSPEEMAEASAALVSPKLEADLQSMKDQEVYARGLTPEEIKEFEALFTQ